MSADGSLHTSGNSADRALLKAALLAGSTDAKRRSAQRVAPPSRDDVLGLAAAARR